MSTNCKSDASNTWEGKQRQNGMKRILFNIMRRWQSTATCAMLRLQSTCLSGQCFDVDIAPFLFLIDKQRSKSVKSMLRHAEPIDMNSNKSSKMEELERSLQTALCSDLLAILLTWGLYPPLKTQGIVT